MYIDEAKIKVIAGKGGDGSASFRREKYIPKGGPDGGDGGDGGDVIFIVNRDAHTLMEYAAKKVFAAAAGGNGLDAKKHGKNGKDLYLSVPPGTIVKQIINGTNPIYQQLADLTQEGQEFRVAKGGKGGLGNVHFATSTNQAPQYAEKGEPGEEKELFLELKLIADIGLVGLPNSGKSTLLSVVSNAKPKIADYPFTTLQPNLGVAKYHDKSVVFADIPGLIEGASAGRGLGDKFLKHIERTHELVHLLDINSQTLEKDYYDIRKELENWSEVLAKKNELVVLNKIDTLDKKDAKKIADKLSKKIDKQVLLISAAAKMGIDELLATIVNKA